MDHVFIEDLVDYIPSKKMAAKLMGFKWYKECINVMISNGINDPHIQGDYTTGPKVHPMLAMAIVTHFRYQEVIHLLYNLIKSSGIEPLDYIIKNIPESDEPRTDGNAYIYIVNNEVTKLTKIGMTTNPKRRLKDLDTGNGVKLTYVLCKFVQNCSTLENKLHNIYHDKREAGEWFHLSESDIDEISEMVDNWFLQHYQKEPLEQVSKFCHRICEHCGRQFGVFFADIVRGKGMFCDNTCASQHRKTLKLEKVCKVCNAPFKTVISSKEFCSTECERLYSITNPTYVVNMDTVESVGNGNRISHRVCQLCHRVIALQDDKIASGQGIYCSKTCARLSRSKIRYEKICKNCGISFTTADNDMQYCSIECEIINTGDCISYSLSDEVNQLITDLKPFILDTSLYSKYGVPKIRTKICEACGNVFSTSLYEIARSGTMFCSSDCQFKNINTPSVSKVCKVCGVVFKTGIDAKYCSETCKNLFNK